MLTELLNINPFLLNELEFKIEDVTIARYSFWTGEEKNERIFNFSVI